MGVWSPLCSGQKLSLPPTATQLSASWAQTDPSLGANPAAWSWEEDTWPGIRTPKSSLGLGHEPLCKASSPCLQSCGCDISGLFCLLLAGGAWGLVCQGLSPRDPLLGRPVQGRGKGAIFRIEHVSALAFWKGWLLNGTTHCSPKPHVAGTKDRAVTLPEQETQGSPGSAEFVGEGPCLGLLNLKVFVARTQLCLWSKVAPSTCK